MDILRAIAIFATFAIIAYFLSWMFLFARSSHIDVSELLFVMRFHKPLSTRTMKRKLLNPNILLAPFKFSRNSLFYSFSGTYMGARSHPHPIRTKSGCAAFCKRFSLPQAVFYGLVGPGKTIRLEPQRQYAVKPDSCDGGRGFRKMSGRAIMDTSWDEEHVVQEFLHDCTSDVARSYRIVTYFDGDILGPIHQLSQPDRGRFQTNRSSGGYARCCSPICKNTGFSEWNKLEALASRLREVHQNRLRRIFAIGWDVMVHCRSRTGEIYILEANQTPGTMLVCEDRDRSAVDNEIENLRKKLKTFNRSL